MVAPEKANESWKGYISPFKLALLAISWIGFCVCLVLVVNGQNHGPLVFLLIGTGLSSLVGLVGVVVAIRKRKSAR